MLAIRIDAELEKKLDAAASALGKNRSLVVREALVRYLEDLEDAEMAELSLQNSQGTKTLDQVRRELGLDR